MRQPMLDRPNLTPDTALATRLFDALRRETGDEPGVTRHAYGEGERRARALVRVEAVRRPSRRDSHRRARLR